MRSIPDADQRRQAVLTPDHAFVWAGAGTGKTHTLTLRALHLLLSAPCAEEAVRSTLLLTFTRKAAAEMQVRLLRYVESLAQSDEFEELSERHPGDWLFLEVAEQAMGGHRFASRFGELRRHAAALCEAAPALQICTMHSFATSLLRRHPLESGLTPEVQFSREDEDWEEDHCERLIQIWWRQQALTESAQTADLSRVLEVTTLSQLFAWLRRLYQHPWMVEVMDRLARPAAPPIESLCRAARTFVCELGEPQGVKIRRHRDQLREFVDRIEAGAPGAWTDFCRVLARKELRGLFLDGRPPKQVAAAIASLPPESAAWFRSFNEFSGVITAGALSREFSETWETWVRIARQFRDWVQGAGIRELRTVTFDEMIRRAVRLLETHEQVRRRERSRLRAILVDEFQDTDPEQLRLIQALLRSDGEKQSGLIGFFVGDLKQSIYRFRGADRTAIQDFYSNFQDSVGSPEPPHQFRLSSCFRTVPAAIDFVNRFFEVELPVAEPQERLQAIRSGPETRPEWIHLQSRQGAPRRSSEARLLCGLETVHQIRRYLEGAAERSYRDILVLVRTAGELDNLLPILEEAGIPVVSEGTRSFYGKPEVMDTLNLLLALHHPGDRLALAALLRSPLVGLQDDQIHGLMSGSFSLHGGDDPIDGLPAVVGRRLLELRDLAACRLRLQLSEWTRAVHSFIPASLYTRPGDRADRASVRVARVLDEYRRQIEDAHVPPLVWLLQSRQKASQGDRYDIDLGEDVTISDESIEAVRVMTVHKAKGLEARLVIIYGWLSILEEIQDGGARRGDPPVLSVGCPDGESVQGFSLPWGPLHVISPDYSRALQKEREAGSREAGRLAYVAATRARDCLVLLTSPNSRSLLPAELRAAADGFRDGGNGSFSICGGTARLIVRIPEELEAQRIPTSPLELDEEAWLGVWDQRAAQAPAPIPGSDLKVPGDLHPEQASGRDGRAVGRLVHLYLERFLLDPAFRETQLWILAEADEELISEPALQLCSRILEAFYTGASRDGSGIPYIRRVQESRVRGREIPFLWQEGGRSRHGVIDLVLEEAGTMLAVDYKTSPHQPAGPVLQDQRRLYTAALQALFPDRRVAFEFWPLIPAPDLT